MSFDLQRDRELTEEERLVATVTSLSQGIPIGGQICLELNLGRAIAAVEREFTEHNLPGREELVEELARWRSHANDGITFARRV